MKRHCRVKHEAMLRREMMARLHDWPTSPYAMPEPSEAEKAAFCEAFIAMSRPPRAAAPAELPQLELFPAP